MTFQKHLRFVGILRKSCGEYSMTDCFFWEAFWILSCPFSVFFCCVVLGCIHTSVVRYTRQWSVSWGSHAASIPWQIASWEKLSGFCAARFHSLLLRGTRLQIHTSVVRYNHTHTSVVSVYKLGFCLSLTFHIVDLWQDYVCCTRSGVTRCTFFMVLYRVPYVPVRVTTLCFGCSSVYVCASSLQNITVPQDYYSPLSFSVEPSCWPCIRWCGTEGF